MHFFAAAVPKVGTCRNAKNFKLIFIENGLFQHAIKNSSCLPPYILLSSFHITTTCAGLIRISQSCCCCWGMKKVIPRTCNALSARGRGSFYENNLPFLDHLVTSVQRCSQKMHFIATHFRFK